MNKLLLFVAIIACIIACAFATRPEKYYRDQFVEFTKKYGRVYGTLDHFETRYQIFKANIMNTERLNAMSKTAKFGVTRFSDMSEEERMEFLGRSQSSVEAGRATRPRLPVSEPVQVTGPVKSFDWVREKMVSSPKNQGNCGSCWAFSTVSGIESAAAMLQHGVPVLSPQQVVDCSTRNSGCNGGDLPPAFDYIVKEGGLVTEEAYPYEAVDGRCRVNKSDIAVVVDGYEEVIPFCQSGGCDRQDQTQFLQNVAEKGPASVCVAANNAWFDYQSGVFDLPCNNSYYSLNHCVLFVGYSEADNAVMIRNSWGAEWGVNGNMYIKAWESDGSATNKCGYLDEATFAKVHYP